MGLRQVAVAGSFTAIMLAASACSSGSSSSTPPPTDTSSSASTAASTPAATNTIRITGAVNGTAEVSLCTGGIGSIALHVDGTGETVHGSISARNFGFVAPDAADFTSGDGPKPTVSSDGQTFTVSGLVLADKVSGRTVSATGSVTCP